MPGRISGRLALVLAATLTAMPSPSIAQHYGGRSHGGGWHGGGGHGHGYGGRYAGGYGYGGGCCNNYYGGYGGGYGCGCMGLGNYAGMPWSCYKSLSEYDLRAIYFYLKSIPRIH
jgi:hypothetical protein